MRLEGLALNTNFGSVSTAGSTANLSAIAVGGSYTLRAGPTALFKNLEIEGSLVGGQSNLVTDDARNVVRLIVAKVIKGGAFAPSVTSILTPYVFPTLVKVYHDSQLELHSTAPDSTGYMPAQKHVKLNIRLNELITYAGQNAADSAAYDIIMYMVSDSAAASNPGFVTGYSNTHFVC